MSQAFNTQDITEQAAEIMGVMFAQPEAQELIAQLMAEGRDATPEEIERIAQLIQSDPTVEPATDEIVQPILASGATSVTLMGDEASVEIDLTR